MKRKRNTKGKQSTRVTINSIEEHQNNLADQTPNIPAPERELPKVPQNISPLNKTSLEPVFTTSPTRGFSPGHREPQSKTTMLFASLFLGAIGLHRLLMGYKNWWIMLITLGGFGIWSIIDFTRIALGKMVMENGTPLKR